MQITAHLWGKARPHRCHKYIFIWTGFHTLLHLPHICFPSVNMWTCTVLSLCYLGQIATQTFVLALGTQTNVSSESQESLSGHFFHLLWANLWHLRDEFPLSEQHKAFISFHKFAMSYCRFDASCEILIGPKISKAKSPVTLQSWLCPQISKLVYSADLKS